ncbi:MAG: guanylate kinase [Rickettsiaceae bacterium]|nr:guanylate kinase [Rickettsiaceae bacterium]MDP5021101.1 guanylate kinase [Rickettsiaceae bacterium]MDP5083437.1 guanylate kinase [Rickettsiaceae bacterium]
MTSSLKNKAMMIILSAPSGGGKTSIANKLLEQDNNLSLSISVTTREARPGEQEGVHYFFKTRAEFDQMVKRGELLEQAEIYGNYYGTPGHSVKQILSAGKDVLFDIDTQGAYQIIQTATGPTLSIFITPPDINVLAARLKARLQDNSEVIEQRLKLAEEEMSHAKNYDYIVVNDDFDMAVKEIQNIILKARKRIVR